MYTPVQPTLQQIKAELDADPLGLGYAALEAAQNWNGLVDALNLSRPGVTVNRRSVSPQEVIEAVVYSELVASTTAAGIAMRDAMTVFFMAMATGGSIDPLNANVRAFFTGAFAAGTTTRANLVALQTRQGSRAELLWGDGVTVNADQVETAARLP